MTKEEIENYDPGLLNDFGGGNIGWWQGYIRSEINRCNEYWSMQMNDLLTSLTEMERQRDSSNSIREAEKKILIKEIEDHTETKLKLTEMEARVKELEKKQKWIDEVGRAQHPDDERPWIPAYLDCRGELEQAEARVKELVDALDALEETRKRMKQAEASLAKLKEAVDRHRNWEIVDRELYRTRDEVGKDKN